MTQERNNWHRSFVSYVRQTDEEGNDRVKVIVEGLKKGVKNQSSSHPMSFFYDIDSIRSGDDWQQQIEQQIQFCGLFIPIITEAYFESNYCKYEFDAYIKKNTKYGFENCIFPIYIESSDRIEKPEKFSGSTWIQMLVRKNFIDMRTIDPMDYVGNIKSPLLHLVNALCMKADEMAISGGGIRWAKVQNNRPFPSEESAEYADLVDYKFLSSNKTQRLIVRQVYRTVSDGIAIDDLFKEVDIFRPNSIGNPKELLYRLKDLQHDGLIKLVPFGANTTFVKKIDGVMNVLDQRGRLIT